MQRQRYGLDPDPTTVVLVNEFELLRPPPAFSNLTDFREL
jgi:hypothetical protein